MADEIKYQIGQLLYVKPEYYSTETAIRSQQGEVTAIQFNDDFGYIDYTLTFPCGAKRPFGAHELQVNKPESK